MTSTPSTKSNYIYLYLSQIYIVIIGIVIVPFHLKYLGAAAYGLIGFYTTIQVIFQLLDVGMTPTLSREASKLHAGVVRQESTQSYLRVLELCFLLITSTIFCISFFSIETFGKSWFSSAELSSDIINQALFYLILVAGVRWFSGLYRAFIAGFENQVWLSKLNIIITTLRFVGVLPVLILFKASIVVFFKYQLLIALLEVFLLALKINCYVRFKFYYIPSLKDVYLLRSTFKLSLTAGCAGILWVLASQSDKIMLSKMISLESFGYFSMVILLVNSITVITAPVTKVTLPKLTKLSELGLRDEFNRLYISTSKNITRIAFTIAIFFSFFGYEVVYIWTADHSIANKIYILVTFYAVGYALLSVSSLTYYFQMAKGNVKLHMIGVFIYLILINLLLLFFINNYGLEGAGYAWLITNFIYMFFWCPYVIFKFEKSLVRKLFITDFIVCLFNIVVVFLFLFLFFKFLNVEGYIYTFLYLVFAFVVGVLAVIAIDSETRDYMLTRLKNSG